MNTRQHARKRFGQNFLVDEVLIERIVARFAQPPINTASVAPPPDVITAPPTIVEIGPGRGAITAGLVHSGNTLIALELDRDLIPLLQTRFSRHPNFSLQQADALQFDFASLAALAPLRLVGNLPYNIATPLIFRLLDHLPLIKDMHFMLQWEVVARLAAGAGDANYGQLSLVVQNLCEVSALFEVPPSAFTPQPKVKSGFVRLTPRQQPLVDAAMHRTFNELVKKAFAQRRKTLRNNLKGYLDPTQIATANVDPQCRAEQLSLAQFAALTRIKVSA